MIIIILSVGLDLASVFTPFYTGNHLRRKMVRATAIELKRQGVTVPDPAKSNSPQVIIILNSLSSFIFIFFFFFNDAGYFRGH